MRQFFERFGEKKDHESVISKILATVVIHAQRRREGPDSPLEVSTCCSTPEVDLYSPVDVSTCHSSLKVSLYSPVDISTCHSTLKISLYSPLEVNICHSIYEIDVYSTAYCSPVHQHI